MTYRIELDRDFCIGAGECVRIAPDVFALDGEEKVILVSDIPHQVSDEAIMEAAKTCPVMAIRLLDADGEIVFPAYE